MSAACPSEPVEPAPKRITPRDIREFREMFSSMSPAPWRPRHHGSLPREELLFDGEGEKMATFRPDDQGHADAHFAAFAREWMPKLLDEIEWLQKRANLAFATDEA